MTVKLGDIVIYHLDQTDNFRNNGAGEAPAIVVRVFDHHYINLKVLADGESNPWITSVRHVSQFDEISRKTSRYWRFSDEWA